MSAPRHISVFYINLDSRPDRRQFMEQQFARLGITAERVPAVTVAEVPEKLVEQVADLRRLWSIGPADLACGLSHQSIWRTILDRQIDAALILEDDALLSDSIIPFLDPEAPQRLSFDLLKLETRRNPVLLGANSTPFATVDLRELQSSQMGAAAYIITLATARTSLAHPQINAMCVDRFFFGRGGPHLLRSRIMQAAPAPAVQLDRLHATSGGDESGPGRSDIRATRRRSKARTAPKLGSVLAVEGKHPTRLLRLLLREPGAIIRTRRPVPFAGDGPAGTGS